MRNSLLGRGPDLEYFEDENTNKKSRVTTVQGRFYLFYH
jgi:hypothetical protein